MQLKGEVIAVSQDSYQGKRGMVQQQILTLLDRGPSPRMKSTVDLLLTDEQKTKLPAHDGELVGMELELAITEIGQAFGGRSRIKGEILKFA